MCVGEHLNRQKGRSSNRALISLILWLTVWYIQGGVWEHWKCFQNCIIAVKCNIFWWHCRGVVQSLLLCSWSVRRQLFCAMQGHRCGLLTCRHVQYNTVACFPLLTWYDCLRGRILTCTFSVHISDRIQAEIILSHQNSLSLNMAMEKSQRERGGREKEGGYLSLSLMLLRSGKVKVLQKQVENALTMPLPTFSAPSPHHQCSNLRSRPHRPLVFPPSSSIYHLSIFTFVANLSSFLYLPIPPQLIIIM